VASSPEASVEILRHESFHGGQVGHPVVDDKELGTLLAKAPPFRGLERVVRYAILRFAPANDAEEPSRASDPQVYASYISLV
jgi:hypothetical protein